MTAKPKRQNDSYVVSAEYQVLNLIIKNPSLLDTHPQITEDNFPHKQARDILSSIKKLFSLKEDVTALSVFRESNKLNDQIELGIIEKIMDFSVTENSLLNAFELLKKASLKNKLLKKVDGLYSEIDTLDELKQDKVADILYDAQQLILSSGDRIDSKKLEECFDSYKEDLIKRKEGKYYSFGDIFLDSVLTRKAAGGQIILISAATGMGKSGYALNLINGMINLSIPAMYFTLEMDEVSTMDRLLAIRTQVPISEWYVKENIDTLLRRVEEEKKSIENKPFRLIDNPSINLNKMKSLIREFKTYYKTDYVCVYVDLITQVKEFIDLEKGGASLATTIEKAVNKLNEIAKTENVCFVCVAQMNRSVDNIKLTKADETDKLKPTLGSIKNSGALAERARAVLSVFRARPYIEKYLPNAPELQYLEDIMELSILKQNQGGVGIGRYLFDGKTMTAVPYTEDDSGIKF